MKVELSLPAEPAKPPRRSWWPWILGMLLSMVLGLQVLVWWRLSGPPPAASIDHEMAAFTKELALKLEQRGLAERAARTWESYLRQDPQAPRAVICFRIGKLWQQAGQFERAIEYFYRAEKWGVGSELTSQLTQRIVTCFKRLGQHSALADELNARTSAGQQQGTPQSSKVLARLQGMPITQRDLEKFISHNVRLTLMQVPAEQRQALKERLLAQYNRPAARQMALRQYVMQQVLLRKALEDKFDRKPEIRRRLQLLRDQLLAQELLQEHVRSRVTVLDDEIAAYYQNHQQEFSEPATVSLWVAAFPTQEAARQALKQIKDEASFQQYAAKDLVKLAQGSDELAGFGSVAGLSAKLFADDHVGLVKKIWPCEKRYLLLWIKDRSVGLVRALDQVRPQIAQRLARQKEQQLQERFIQELFRHYDVEFYDRPVLGPQTSQSRRAQSGDPSQASDKQVPSANQPSADQSSADQQLPSKQQQGQ